MNTPPLPRRMNPAAGDFFHLPRRSLMYWWCRTSPSTGEDFFPEMRQ